jgi:hypothetical protein
MNPHKLYLSLFAICAFVILIAGSAWREHVRDDAHRDAVLETQKSDIAGLEQQIAEARNAAQAQIAELERERQALSRAPERVPEIIRQLVPMQTPIQQMGPITAQAPPDAPSAVITKQQEVDLARYALSCKECATERDELEEETKNDADVIARQKLEIEAAKESAKGGSVWQRSLRIAKWGLVFGGLGYVLGRAQR